jgi:ABC-type nitrate/sulfonate/bicarbonate transport system permease component
MPEAFVKAAARGAIAIVIVAVVWELAATVVPPFVMPHLGPVLGKIFDLAFAAELARNALASGFRIMAGYLLALLVGLPSGLALRQVPELRFVFGALFAGLAAVPFVLLAPVMILWFGIGSVAPVALAFAAAVFALVGGLMTSRDLARPPAFVSAPPPIKPAAPLAASVVEAARSAFLVAVAAVIVSEMLGSQVGLGYLLEYATSTFDSVTMFAVVIIVGLSSALVSALFRTIEVQVGN